MATPNRLICFLVLIYTRVTGCLNTAPHLSIGTHECKGNTSLTCTVNSLNISTDGWGWACYRHSSTTRLMTNGVELKPTGKYTEVINGTSFTLTIHRTGPKDAGNYTCEHKYQTSNKDYLDIICEASNFTCTTADNKLVITVGYSFPAASFTSVTVTNDLSNDGPISITGTVLTSRSNDETFVTTWTSNEVLSSGYNSINIVADPGRVSHNCSVPIEAATSIGVRMKMELTTFSLIIGALPSVSVIISVLLN